MGRFLGTGRVTSRARPIERPGTSRGGAIGVGRRPRRRRAVPDVAGDVEPASNRVPHGPGRPGDRHDRPEAGSRHCIDRLARSPRLFWPISDVGTRLKSTHFPQVARASTRIVRGREASGPDRADFAIFPELLQFAARPADPTLIGRDPTREDQGPDGPSRARKDAGGGGARSRPGGMIRAVCAQDGATSDRPGGSPLLAALAGAAPADRARRPSGPPSG